MKILFGIQGTGNGHISRGRMMAKHFADRGIDVRYLFSGRAADKFFDMAIFGDYAYRRGLTFFSENGKVSYPKTIISNNIFQFLRDAKTLEVENYDLLITDFEPVTAWAAKFAGKPTLGIGHQYAFGHNIPRAGNNPIAALTMKLFAPTTEAVGLHWDAFGNPILPPIIDNSIARWQDDRTKGKKIVVYLPFENQQFVHSLLKGISGYDFYIYSPDVADSDHAHIHFRKTSHDGFKKDLTSACGVISNSGFELISECLHLGLQILTKPQAAQMEQQSNAAALQQLGYAQTTKRLDEPTVRQWLASLNHRQPLRYPDVAARLVDWIANGRQQPIAQLSDELWQEVKAL